MPFEIRLSPQQTKQANQEWIMAGQYGGTMIAQLRADLTPDGEATAGALHVEILNAGEAIAINALLVRIRARQGLHRLLAQVITRHRADQAAQSDRLPASITFSVTAADIRKGRRFKACECPIALAANRVLCVGEKVSIAVQRGRILLTRFSGQEPFAVYHLPTTASEFCESFDRHGPNGHAAGPFILTAYLDPK